MSVILKYEALFYPKEINSALELLIKKNVFILHKSNKFDFYSV